MNNSGSYWKAFESTGSVQQYLVYKQVQQQETGQQALPMGEKHDNRNTGPGSAGSESGRI